MRVAEASREENATRSFRGMQAEILRCNILLLNRACFLLTPCLPMYGFVDRMNDRPLIAVVLGLFIALSGSLAAPARGQGLCRAAITLAERASGIPDRLLQAVAIIESGRRDPSGAVAAWPWTINVEGVGEVFDTKAQALAAVTAHRARGARSIDVGCMQVNLMHHPDAFASLDEAFDPAANARYAARFLQKLLLQTGSWPRAVAGYHSLTPDIGGEYARKVLAIWAQPERPAAPGAPPASEATRLASAPAAPTNLPASLPAPGRMLAQPGGSGPSMVGRTLESYRALPTRLAYNSSGPRL